MTTIRIGRRRQYVNLDSRSVNDSSLSFRARGVLAWLLEKPDDWSVRADAIAAQGTEGRDAIRTALRELESAGYIERRKFRTDDGTWASECTVWEHPDQSGKPALVNQPRLTSDGELGPVLKVSKETSQPKKKPTPSKPGAKRYGPEADRLAKAEWERRTRKPVCGFLAMRERIQDAIDAGTSVADLERALPTMSVFSRNSFDLALAQAGPRKNGYRPPIIDTDRTGPSRVLTEDDL